MYQLKRVSTAPATAMRIQVDQPTEGDGGFGQGGVYYFEPSGQDGDTHQVSEVAAKAIMGDPGLVQHFECSPALPKPEPEAAQPAAAPEPEAEPDSATAGKGRRRGAGGR